MFLQFESDKALVYDLLKKSERKELDVGWTVTIRRTEPRSSTLDELWEGARSQSLPQTRKRKPTRKDVEIGTWTERDRTGIWLTDKRTGKTVAEWWDEDAREMFEQGWFKPGDVRHQGITGRAFEESVMEYAESVGLLAGSKYLPASSTPPAVVPTEPRKRQRPGPGTLEFLPDSPEFLAYTIDEIGYRDKIDNAFLNAITRANKSR